MEVPAERYRPSQKPMPHPLNPMEYSDDVIVRKVRGNGRIRYKEEEYHVGEAFSEHDVGLKFNPLGE